MVAPFSQIELEGWNAKAAAYDRWLGTISRQAVPDILAALGPIAPGRRVLDTCCGTGHLTACLAGAGAEVEGLDRSPAMLEIARSAHPEVRFVEGDAEALPHEDRSFDDVVCAFGLLHCADPDAALAEAWRVMRPGGKLVFTVWSGPDRGNAFFRILNGAILSHGTMEIDLPPAPPMFRLADPEAVAAACLRAGFTRAATRTVDMTWCPREGEDMPRMIRESLVRAALLLDLQAPAARDAIEAELVRRAEATRRDDCLHLPFPGALSVAVKA